MEYSDVLRIAGATVLKYEKFGSYQGDWFAFIKLDGKRGWIHGSYGSCSGCDAIEAEFGFNLDTKHPHSERRFYNPIEDGFVDNCDVCNRDKERLVNFGKKYIEEILTQAEAEKIARENIEWDDDAERMLNFVKTNS